MTAHPRNRFAVSDGRERVRVLDGHLEIRSAPGAGTVVDARIPLPAPQDVANAEANLLPS